MPCGGAAALGQHTGITSAKPGSQFRYASSPFRQMYWPRFASFKAAEICIKIKIHKKNI